MRNIKLIIEYDGSDFSGWQVQPKLPTVQGEIERSLTQVTQTAVKLTAAGRTDAGVHATGQVANFKTESQRPLDSIVKGGNALLPYSVRLKGAEEVEESFNARFDAKSRAYIYRINLTPVAIGRQYSWHYPYQIDVDRMNRACQWLLGEKDFKAFCSSSAQLDHHRCFVFSAAWVRRFDELRFEMKANRFVHNMVRIIVGTCLFIGRGKQEPDYIMEIVQSRDRSRAGATAPPHGLCLTKVEY